MTNILNYINSIDWTWVHEMWAAIEVWDSLIAIALVVAIILFGFLALLVGEIRWRWKIRWLKKQGYHRYLKGVPAYGNGAFYGWRNDKTNKQIDERHVDLLSYKDLVAKLS